MRTIKPNHWFWILWILLGLYLGHFRALPLAPVGMHQGAQCDRASVAWNYYHESMNFFLPRVSEDRAAEGVAGMEFPVIPYTVAVFYKIFGPHEIIYRLLLYVIVSFGVFSAWRITALFMQRTVHRILVTFGWYCSPVLVFYTANFLPDPAAMAFSMAALYHLLKHALDLEPGRNLRLYLAFITLAGLIKVSFLITHVAAFMLLAGWRFVKAEDGLILRYRPKEWLTFMLPLLPVAAWYTYAAQLTARTWNTHFLQKANPAGSLREFAENTRYAFSTWQESLYTPKLIYALLLLLLFTLLFRWKRAPLPAMLTALLLAGFGAAFVLFNVQYRYHDYYFVLLMPGLFFGWVYLQQLWLENRVMFLGLIGILQMLFFWIMPVKNLFHAEDMMLQRYAQGNYYHQNAFEGTDELVSRRDTLQKIIPDGKRVFFAFDPTPNTGLYLLQRRGVRISTDFDTTITRGILTDSKATFLVLNDSARWFRNYEPALKTGSTLVYSGDRVWVYRLSK